MHALRLPRAIAGKGGKYNSCCCGKAWSSPRGVPYSRNATLMRCHPPKVAVVLLCVAAILSGCAPQQPLYLRNSGDLSHYIGMSQTIDNADVPEPPFSEVQGAIRPFSLDGTGPQGLLAFDLGRDHSQSPGKRQGDATDRRAGPRPADVPDVESRGGAHDLRSGDRGDRCRVSASTPAYRCSTPS